MMLKSRSNFVILFLFSTLNSFSQVNTISIDSVNIDISFNSIKQNLCVQFINKSKVKVVLPWKESLPYSDFEGEVKFNIYVVNNLNKQLLKVTENIPQYVFESNDIEIKKRGSISKIIELEQMISRNEICKYDYIYVQYILREKIITSNRLGLK
jgi:hypothetical protein